MSKARRKIKISVFTSGGKFPVLTLSYINTALSQSAFSVYKCYIIITNIVWIFSQFGTPNFHSMLFLASVLTLGSAP
jgi:hypothetical protein